MIKTAVLINIDQILDMGVGHTVYCGYTGSQVQQFVSN